MDTIDFGPTVQATGTVAIGVGPEQLTAPTPCPDYTVADIVDHVVGLTHEFTLSARKEPSPVGGPSGEGDRLPAGWRAELPGQLADLAAAWTDPAAYDGTTHAGPVELPGRSAALVALTELVVHGWDLARATGQPYAPDPTAVGLATGWVISFPAPANDDGGLFGPPVEVPDDASPMDRLLGLTGRDPGWAPPA